MPYTAVIISLISPLLSCLASYYAYKSKKGVQEIHVMINSRMSAWLLAAKEAAHAEGVRSVLAQGVAKELIGTAQIAAAKLLVEAKEQAEQAGKCKFPG